MVETLFSQNMMTCFTKVIPQNNIHGLWFYHQSHVALTYRTVIIFLYV